MLEARDCGAGSGPLRAHDCAGTVAIVGAFVPAIHIGVPATRDAVSPDLGSRYGAGARRYGEMAVWMAWYHPYEAAPPARLGRARPEIIVRLRRFA